MEPASRNTALGILNAITRWPQVVMKGGSVVSQLLKLQDAFCEYERNTGQALQEELRFAVVFRCVTDSSELGHNMLQLQVQDGSTYSDLHELVVRYNKENLKWSDSMRLAPETSADIVPMDADRVLEKGKKRKSKGKDKQRKGKQGKNESKGKGMNVKGTGWKVVELREFFFNMENGSLPLGSPDCGIGIAGSRVKLPQRLLQHYDEPYLAMLRRELCVAGCRPRIVKGPATKPVELQDDVGNDGEREIDEQQRGGRARFGFWWPLQEEFEPHTPFSSLQNIDDKYGGDEAAPKDARVSKVVVHQIGMHHGDETAMIPDDLDMVDVDGISEHGFVPTASD
eukprot:s3069_g14.t1